MVSEFPGNVFVARNYPPPMNADNVTVIKTEAVTPQVSVTGSDSVNAGDLIDSATAAEMLGVTTNNLRQMVHKGRLPVADRKGRKNLFSRDAVNQLAQRRNAK